MPDAINYNHPDRDWLYQQMIDLEAMYREDGGLLGFRACLIRRGIPEPPSRATYAVFRKALTLWFIEKKLFLIMPQNLVDRRYEFAELLSDEELNDAMELHGSSFDPMEDDRNDTLDDLVYVYQASEIQALLPMTAGVEEAGEGEEPGEGARDGDLSDSPPEEEEDGEEVTVRTAKATGRGAPAAASAARRAAGRRADSPPDPKSKSARVVDGKLKNQISQNAWARRKKVTPKRLKN